MRLSSNIMRFFSNFGINKTVDIFADAGFSAIDFNCDIQQFHDDTHDKSFYTELKKYAEGKGIVFGQTHAPFASAYVDNEKAEKRFSEIITSMRFSSYLGAPFMVVHPCQHFDYSTFTCTNSPCYPYDFIYHKGILSYLFNIIPSFSCIHIYF